MRKYQHAIYAFIVIAILGLTAMVITINLRSNQQAPADQAASSQRRLKLPVSSLKKGQLVTGQTAVRDVIGLPAFKDFAEFIFPINQQLPDRDMRLDDIQPLLPYHSHIDTASTVRVVNDLIQARQRQEKVFYPIYSEAEMRKDPEKRNSGLFFFRGRKNAPTAVISPGGGFEYVSAIHESMPLALALSQKGYNAFSVQYRLGSEQKAAEDLAAGLAFISRNEKQLQVSLRNYSVWGASAGARMAADIASYGPDTFGADFKSRPAAVIMQYTSRSEFRRTDPPTYAVVGDDDAIAPPAIMRQRINNLKKAGVIAEFHHFPRLEHGFALGIGTSAEGWQNSALAFWERQLAPNQKR
ncbi:MAG: alpha/beta hydrolase [Oenococcus sp.]|uniref:alpha/beta hydrolase n=1 Tax=Oenococcus sp. TaxID=1979414 RepID=UPI0039ECC9E3